MAKELEYKHDTIKDELFYLGHQKDFTKEQLHNITEFSRTTKDCGSVHLQDYLLVVLTSTLKLKFVLSIAYNRAKATMEIYDVCTGAAYRGQKVASRALNYLVSYALTRGYKTIWLGIINPLLSKLYTKLGFTENIQITTKTALGTRWPFLFISSTYKEGFSSYDISSAQEIYKSLTPIYTILKDFKPVQKEEYQVKLSDVWEIYKNILSPSSRNEIGGRLEIVEPNTLGVTYVTAGSAFNYDFTIYTGCWPIMFHTHPRSAYAKYSYGSGLPSILDYLQYLQCEAEQFLVFAVEGVFTVNMPKVFVYIYSILNAADRQHTQNGLVSALSALESHREMKSIQDITDNEGDILMIEHNDPFKMYSTNKQWKARVRHANERIISSIRSINLYHLLPQYIQDYFIQHMGEEIRKMLNTSIHVEYFPFTERKRTVSLIYHYY